MTDGLFRRCGFIYFIGLYVLIFVDLIIPHGYKFVICDYDKLIYLLYWVWTLYINKHHNNKKMADEEGEFYVDSEEEQVRQVIKIEQANPIYTKPVSQQPKKVSLKMLQVAKKESPTLYQYFRINKKSQTQQSEEEVGQFNAQCPFTEFYSKEQLIYQRYNNQPFNIINETVYFSGTFIPKNIIFDYLKQDSNSLIDIIQQYFEVRDVGQVYSDPDDPIFDSNFESGNLFAVFKVAKNTYDLVMQNDTNSRGNNQWFYFSVQKLVSGVDYTFNVVNFTKNDSLFNYGMSPVCYSTIGNKKNGTEWFRIGKEVVYKKGLIPRQNSRRCYYQLSFKVNWKYNNDKLYIAHSYPYTYTTLNNFMDQVLSKNKDIVSKITIGKTLSKKPIEALIISQQINKKRDNRKALVFMARQHPGETQGSFVCEGVVEKLLQKTKQNETLRKNYVIFIIPMVNPDGVIFGHYRTNLAGKDLNRKWDATQKQQTCPQVTSIKSFLLEISKQRQIRFVIDLHGHSKKLNSFFYGNPCQQNPQYVRIFPFICSKLNPAIQFYDCTFATEEYKRKAARVYLSYYYKQLHVYTFESSFFGYVKDGKKYEFTPKEYGNLGHTLVQVLQLQLENDNKNGHDYRSSLKEGASSSNLFAKYFTELKNNKSLMQIGNNMDSGSESRPEEGEVNINEVPKMKVEIKKAQTPTMTEDNISISKNNSRRSHSRKAYRQIKQYRQVNKPVRNFRFLEISRVNSVLPDKYQLGLQPIRKKQTQIPLSRNQSAILRVNTHSQTQRQVMINECRDNEIETTYNLSNSVKLQPRAINEKRYSSVIKNTTRNNNIIFKIDFLNPGSYNVREKKYFNAYSQTVISFERQRMDKNRSSQLFPLVESPENAQRLSKTNPVKYDTMKVGMKREAQIFLNGMVKKYLVEKQVRSRDATKCVERPLSIKKKQIYKK